MPTITQLRARPKDRELRLVYSDWLESQGHPQGELIAVQDAAQRCETAVEFERARARAAEVVEAHHDSLGPEVEILAGEGRKLWAVWEGGFIRRLELLIDEPRPAPGVGMRGWSLLLARCLMHPSLALLEQLLVRVDLRGEPLDEVQATCAIVVGGFQSWAGFTAWEGGGEGGEDVVQPPLELGLCTHRMPTAELRGYVARDLPRLDVRWYGRDLTWLPPQPGSPVIDLEHALAELPEGEHCDLAWFDANGHFSDGFTNTDASARVHVRQLAEGRGGQSLASVDPVPQRRIARLFDALAARFDTRPSAHPFAPRRLAERRPERVELDDACARLNASGAVAASLARFTEVDWWWVEERRDGQAWAGLCGLGAEQTLVLGR